MCAVGTGTGVKLRGESEAGAAATEGCALLVLSSGDVDDGSSVVDGDEDTAGALASSGTTVAVGVAVAASLAATFEATSAVVSPPCDACTAARGTDALTGDVDGVAASSTGGQRSTGSRGVASTHEGSESAPRTIRSQRSGG